MAKIGVSTALLNTNISGKPFLHSVEVSVKDSLRRIVVIDDELKVGLRDEIEQLVSAGIKVVFWDSLFDEVKVLPALRIARDCRNELKESDPIIFIFTSGTTGKDDHSIF